MVRLLHFLLLAVFFQGSWTRRITAQTAQLAQSLQLDSSDRATNDCEYVSPAEAPQNEGYRDMHLLTNQMWSAPDNTSADGKHDLFYAYGPEFRDKGQIGAWKYDDIASENFIKFWWSKSSCMGMVGSGGCTDGRGNEPGVLSVKLNPSAGMRWGYALVKKFYENDPVEVSFGTMTLVKVVDTWRLQVEGGCYLDHVYVCSSSSYVAKYKDANDNSCSSTCTNGVCNDPPAESKTEDPAVEASPEDTKSDEPSPATREQPVADVSVSDYNTPAAAVTPSVNDSKKVVDVSVSDSNKVSPPHILSGATWSTPTTTTTASGASSCFTSKAYLGLLIGSLIWASVQQGSYS